LGALLSDRLWPYPPTFDLVGKAWQVQTP